MLSKSKFQEFSGLISDVKRLENEKVTSLWWFEYQMKIKTEFKPITKKKNYQLYYSNVLIFKKKYGFIL